MTRQRRTTSHGYGVDKPSTANLFDDADNKLFNNICEQYGTVWQWHTQFNPTKSQLSLLVVL